MYVCTYEALPLTESTSVLCFNGWIWMDEKKINDRQDMLMSIMSKANLIIYLIMADYEACSAV